MLYKENWAETKEKFIGWWGHKNTGRPLMIVTAQKEGALPLPSELQAQNVFDQYQNAPHMIARYRRFCETHDFLAESFPNMSVDFGPGSIAAYLGSDITFSKDTVWFSECVPEWDAFPPLRFDAQNSCWQAHYALAKEAQSLAKGDFYVAIPDLMENLDVLASLRGAENTIYDLMDEPDEVKKRIAQVQDLYFDYYDQFYELLKTPADKSSCYTVFQIWGPGKVAKLQCDFSAMISPIQFREFIQEPLRRQAQKLDHVLYHLDGPDAIRHLDALMEIEEIDALQWTSGDHGPDGTLKDWDVIYDKARAAGKSLWVKVYTGELDDWISNTDRLVKKYGSHSLFLYFPEMPRKDADKLLQYADKHWSNIPGTFSGGHSKEYK